MWIVAVAWIYVVGLMALTEASAVAGIMTFFGYCVLPLSILYYLTGSGRRRRKAAAAQAAVTHPADAGRVTAPAEGGAGGGDDGSAG